MNHRILKYFLIFSTLVSSVYVTYVAYIFNQGVGSQILAATTEDSYPLIPSFLALAYLRNGPVPEHETEDGQPTISFTIAGCGTGANCDRVIEVLNILLSRGADPNQAHNGIPVLHESILFGELRVIETLLSKGADPKKTFSHPGSPAHGLDAVEFLSFLTNKDSTRYQAITHVFEKHN